MTFTVAMCQGAGQMRDIFRETLWVVWGLSKEHLPRETGLQYRVGLHQHGGLCSQPLLVLHIVAHIAELLLHHPHCLKVGRVVEGVATQQQELTEDGDQGLGCFHCPFHHPQ